MTEGSTVEGLVKAGLAGNTGLAGKGDCDGKGCPGAADVFVDLQIWPEMIHVWPLFWPELAAGKRAIDAAGAFIRRALGT